MANAGMISTTIQNYKRLQERRIVFEFALPHDCSTEQLRQVPVLVENIIRAQEKTRFDRSHFRGFGESALEFETVYIVLDRSEEHTSELQSLMRISYAVFCLKKKKKNITTKTTQLEHT